jgi:hypothetical protein
MNRWIALYGSPINDGADAPSGTENPADGCKFNFPEAALGEVAVSTHRRPWRWSAFQQANSQYQFLLKPEAVIASSR